MKIDKKYKKFLIRRLLFVLEDLLEQKFFTLIQSLSKNKIFNKQYNLLLLEKEKIEQKIELYFK